jgi:hypothetical protein
MPNSPVERAAFRPRFTDHPDCDRLTNGLHPIADHCVRCANAIRASRPRAYRVRDLSGNIIVADSVDVRYA